MDSTAVAEEVTPSASIADSLPTIRVRPSQFNARTVAEDGTLLLFNSFSGAFSGLPARSRAQAELLLQRKGCAIEQTGLAKYMFDRGFLVPETTNELHKLRSLHGFQHYRADRMELILLSSEECNFRCVYCYETFSRGTMEPWVRQAVVAMTERRIKYLRCLNVTYFGGEPLLGMEAIRDISPRLQQLAKENGVEFASHMTTNGYLLTKDVLSELLSYDCRDYQITIDGSPSDHDCKRGLKEGGPSFQTIYDNLKDARELSEQFLITIRINFDRDNLPRLHSFFELLKNDFAGDSRFEIRFRPVGKWGGANDEQLNIYPIEAASSKEITGHSARLDLVKTASMMGLRSEAQLPWIQAQSGRGICYAARPHNLIIGADGKIMKCTVALDQKDFNIVGYLKEDGFPDIDYEKFSKWVVSAFEDDDTCKKCFFLPTCQGISCPKPRIAGEKRPCPPEKTQIGETLRSLWEEKKTKGNLCRVVQAESATQAENAKTRDDRYVNEVASPVLSVSQQFQDENLGVIV